MKLRRKEMRNWCAALAIGALLALPMGAQEKTAARSDDTAATATAAEKSAASSNSAASSIAVPTNGVFALPAKPQPTPFPGPAAAPEDTRAPGLLVPRYELAG